MLDDISSIWNRQRIRRNREGVSQCGRPFPLHGIPSALNTVDYGIEMNEKELNIYESKLEILPHLSCSKLIKYICVCIMEENNIALPKDPESMQTLYTFSGEDIRNNLRFIAVSC